MAEASKRIDLAAPLLSVRRHGLLDGRRWRYGESDDDATPGGVPFGWERRPGHPKSVHSMTQPLPESDQEAAGRCSDALSRADSCYTVNCSVAGLSDAAGAAAPATAPGTRGSVMMDRFLLAAKEQCVFRKASAAANTRAPAGDRLPGRLPVQLLPAIHAQCNHVKDTDSNEDGDEWEVHSTAGFASKRSCGLLPTRCAKSALLLLNPARSTMRRRRGSGRRETNPLLPPIGQRPDHDAGMRGWLEVYMSSLLRSDRGAVHPKATHLGLLLVLDRTDGDADSPQPLPKCGSPPTAKVGVGKIHLRRDAVDHGFLPPRSQEKTAARRDNMVLALPSPKTPSESWLSRTLPSVSNRPPAMSFMGIHVQQLRKQHAPSRWCSSDQAKVVDHGARPRQIRI